MNDGQPAGMTPAQCDDAVVVLQTLMQHPAVPLVLQFLAEQRDEMQRAVMYGALDEVDKWRGAYLAFGVALNCLVPTQEQVAQGDLDSLVIKHYRELAEQLRELAGQPGQPPAGGEA